MQNLLLLPLNQFLVNQVHNPIAADWLYVDGVGFAEVGRTQARDGLEGDLGLPCFWGEYCENAVILLTNGQCENVVHVIVLEVDQVLIAVS